jgi:protein-tyrosine-phosphatase
MILILGAADTGRAPMTAALLRRLLSAGSITYIVESAGILGHEGDPASADAQQTMEQTGLDISDHIARTLTAELAAQAALLIAVDSGTALVGRAQNPDAAARIVTLGELAGRPRDIPDPFKMQIGAWLTYAREIEQLLRMALPRILTLLGDPAAVAPTPTPTPVAVRSVPEPTPIVESAATQLPSLARIQAVQRLTQLLTVAAHMPGVLDWAVARDQIEADLVRCQDPCTPQDLAPALVGLLRAVVALTPNTPTATQIERLCEAIGLLKQSVSAGAVASFSAQIPSWSQLA